MEGIREIVIGFALGAVTAPIWGTMLWELWEGVFRPRLISNREVERLAAEMRAHHGRRALEMTCVEEGRSWWDCDSFEQGKWRRVRQRLKRAAAHQTD